MMALKRLLPSNLPKAMSSAPSRRPPSVTAISGIVVTTAMNTVPMKLMTTAPEAVPR